jgi:hypothetical protein
MFSRCEVVLVSPLAYDDNYNGNGAISSQIMKMIIFKWRLVPIQKVLRFVSHPTLQKRIKTVTNFPAGNE